MGNVVVVFADVPYNHDHLSCLIVYKCVSEDPETIWLPLNMEQIVGNHTEFAVVDSITGVPALCSSSSPHQMLGLDPYELLRNVGKVLVPLLSKFLVQASTN